MTFPVAVGLEYDQHLPMPSVSIDVEQDGHEFRVNGETLTAYFRSVRDLGLLGELLADEDVRSVLSANHASVSVSNANSFRDHGACLIGYAILKELYCSPVDLDHELEACYNQFLQNEGYTQPSTFSLLHNPVSLFVESDTLMQVTGYLIGNGNNAGKEIWLESAFEEGIPRLTIIPVETHYLRQRTSVSVILDEESSWTQPIRLGVFAANRFLAYCANRDGIPHQTKIELRVSHVQGLLEIGVDRGLLRLPMLIYTGTMSDSTPAEPSVVLQKMRESLRAAKQDNQDLKRSAKKGEINES